MRLTRVTEGYLSQENQWSPLKCTDVDVPRVEDLGGFELHLEDLSALRVDWESEHQRWTRTRLKRKAHRPVDVRADDETLLPPLA